MGFMVRHAFLLFIILVFLSSTGQANQICRDNIRPSTPDARFVINGDGTVRDTATDLMWKRCAEGQTGTDCAAGSETTYTWQQALEHAEQTSFAGYSDWRLPNINELQSIIEQRCHSPAINLTVFPNAPSHGFWSASPRAGHSNFAWFVAFGVGYVHSYLKDDYLAVRLVRGGQ